MKSTVQKALTIAALLLATTAHSTTTVQELSGKFAIRTVLKSTYLTARPGNHSIDAVVTSSTVPQNDGLFSFQRVHPGNNITIKTVSNHFVSAAGGGGRGGSFDAATTLQTELTRPTEQALFYPLFNRKSLSYALTTRRGYYLTALGGGGKITNAFHTDATTVNAWELFQITKCGNLGSGYEYMIKPKGFSRPISPNGKSVLRLSTINGTDIYKLFLTQPNNTVRFIERGPCTYAIQTNLGSYVGANENGHVFDTIGSLDTPPKGLSTYFELMPVF